MKRRNFVVATSGLLAATSLQSSEITHMNSSEGSNEFYELRQYELKFGGNQGAFMPYMKEVLIPALMGIGATNAAVFTEEGAAEPRKMWLMTAFPNLTTYEKSLSLLTDSAFLEQSKTYIEAGQIFNRYTSFLLRAIDGMPNMIAPSYPNPLFELRIYEGKNEDAVRRKIAMFDDEEIELFLKVGLNPVMFGNMIIGPHMPALVYMLSFEDMDARQKAWGEFLKHPDWNEMKAKPKYADTVSNIRKIFLRLA